MRISGSMVQGCTLEPTRKLPDNYHRTIRKHWAAARLLNHPGLLPPPLLEWPSQYCRLNCYRGSEYPAVFYFLPYREECQETPEKYCQRDISKL